MSSQTTIPCLFMRGGTSKGPFFNRNHLPQDLDQLAKVLVRAVGAGHRLNIDGIGGGNAVTTKVAMVSPSTDEWADVDYFFAQVNVEDEGVDFSPTCGNMLAGVGPAAIEMGLIPAQPGQTAIKIRAVNTGARVEAVVQTSHDPKPVVEYAGDEAIAGVPGCAAPIQLDFFGVVGSKTGALFSTGSAMEQIEGVDVTLVDVAVPMMIVRAADLGKTGYESADELTADRAFMDRLEGLRLQAGERMGLGDVSKKVVPKVGLLSPPQGEGTVNIRYFMPWQCHPSLAVTGSMAFAGCVLAPGTVAEGLVRLDADADKVVFEHPMGTMETTVNYDVANGQLELHSAGTMRTARLLMRGEIMVPGG
uniref:4-oxalomesaconate tautomerase n=1 Tax=uncultured Thiotrichaceae bacterium TaxID=298394 RepID=A0A6S6UKW5_9GAMM|nr:MAG: FIG01143472: hypothetical protein [uncultured Thiotrichaceae bacterium]